MMRVDDVISKLQYIRDTYGNIEVTLLENERYISVSGISVDRDSKELNKKYLFLY